MRNQHHFFRIFFKSSSDRLFINIFTLAWFLFFTINETCGQVELDEEEVLPESLDEVDGYYKEEGWYYFVMV